MSAKKKILAIGLTKNRGGMETFFHNYYEKLKSQFQFDFLAVDDLAFSEEYQKTGKIHFVQNPKRRPLSYHRALKKILREGNYDVVHVNMLSAANIVPVKAALAEKVPKIIVHSHNAGLPKGNIRAILHYKNKKYLKEPNLVRLACSEESGRWLFGEDSNFTVINNAIDLKKFRFSSRNRKYIRHKYNISDSDVLLGNVGRLCEQKNQMFLVNILARLKDEKIKLMFVGDGDQKAVLQDKINEKGLREKVIFVPNVEDIEKYYSAFDLFVFPSIFEGLGMAAVEAMAAGVHCLLSKPLSKQALFKHHGICLDLDTEIWENEIRARIKKPNKRLDLRRTIRDFGFDISSEYKKIEEIYDAENDDKIDFVIMWVDPNDLKWQKEKSKFIPSSAEDATAQRYRDWDTLPYWFRGVEEYAPWVNNIYFVTYGHIPNWLNTHHPKLKIVNHKDFIPKKYLPTFSANPIELNLHRIKGLSNNFVFFNDDFFIVNNVKPGDFFKNGLPCDSACLYNNGNNTKVIDSIFENDMNVINKHFSKKKVMISNFSKWVNIKNGKYLANLLRYGFKKKFIGIHFRHLPQSFSKKSFYEMWELEPNLLDSTCKNKFRNASDVNQWLIKYYQICKGSFVPKYVNYGKYYEYSMGSKTLERAILGEKYKVVCINDTVSENDFDSMKKMTEDVFARKFPDKSEFER